MIDPVPTEAPVKAATADGTDADTEPSRPLWTWALLEVGSLVVVGVLAALCARPLLEEWGFIKLFNHSGVGSYWDRVPIFPLRPLQGIPYVLQWEVGTGSSSGFAVGFLLMLLLRYAVAWWAVSGFLSAGSRWIVALLATILPTWTAEWYLRYSAAHLSAVFYFVVLGSVLRATRRLSRGNLICGAAATALMLATYEALVVCVVVLPLAAGLLACPTPGRLDVTSGQAWGRVARAAVPVVTGGALYAIYAVVATWKLGSGYEGSVVQHGRLRTVSGIRVALGDLYSTAFVSSALVPVFFVLVLAVIAGPAITALPSRTSRLANAAGLAALVAVLPLAAAPYVVNPGFSADPDRVLFPVSVSFATVCVMAAVRYGSPASALSRRLGSTLLAAAVLLATGTPAADAYRYHQVQMEVVVNTVRIAGEHGATSVVLADYSGRLGDVYTLYPPTLQILLDAEGLSLLAVICTPRDIDRVNPVAQRSLIPTTPRCDAPGVIMPGQLIINVTQVGNDLRFSAA